MNSDEARPASQLPSRKPIILIGAPSGAGKTVLSQRIISGDFSHIALRAVRAEQPVRFDLKALPEDLPRDRVLILECSTHKLAQLSETDQWRRMLDIVRESELVIHVDLEVSRPVVVRQYFLRIFTGPKRMHPFLRATQLSKYRNALMYLVTRRLYYASVAWRQFGRALVAEMPSRVVMVHARREGTNYRMTVETVDGANQAT